ncbi:hypothetical protein [Chryseobacterium carnipullorum]|nr:hypothetical protein [Chryseobacterium carnipullorum]
MISLKILPLTARFTTGITDVYKLNSGDADRNNALRIGLAYQFR